MTRQPIRRFFPPRPLWLGLLFCCLCLPPVALAQNSQSTPAATASPSAGGADNAAREQLKEEREVLEKQAERHYNGIKDLLDWLWKILGVVAAVLIGVFSWWFWSSKQELKESIDAVVRRQIEAQGVRSVQDELLRLRNEVEDLRRIKAEYESLRDDVADLQAYKTRKVVWVVPAGTPELKTEKDEFRRAGIANVEDRAVTPGNPINLSDADLVIFSFDGTPDARRIEARIVEALSQRRQRVPLLFYVQHPVRLDTPDFELLRDYPWYMPVNFLLTLISETRVLIRRSV